MLVHRHFFAYEEEACLFCLRFLVQSSSLGIWYSLMVMPISNSPSSSELVEKVSQHD
jgi:hypothetical protein